MSMEHWWNDTDRGKTEILGRRRVTMTLCSPQIPHEQALGSNPDLRCEPPQLGPSMKQCIQLKTSYPITVRYILILSSSTFKYISFLLPARSQNKTLHEYPILSARATFPTPLKSLDYGRILMSP